MVIGNVIINITRKEKNMKTYNKTIEDIFNKVDKLEKNMEEKFDKLMELWKPRDKDILELEYDIQTRNLKKQEENKENK